MAKLAKIVIGSETTVPYPESEMDDLKEVLGYHGVFADMKRVFNLDRGTVQNVVKTGRGRKKNVDLIRAYVKGYKKETA